MAPSTSKSTTKNNSANPDDHNGKADSADDSLDSGDSVEKPAPEVGSASSSDENQSSQRLDPTRYGDWEKNGRCIDF